MILLTKKVRGKEARKNKERKREIYVNRFITHTSEPGRGHAAGEAILVYFLRKRETLEVTNLQAFTPVGALFFREASVTFGHSSE